ncbi:MAG: DUF4349 domain-containing protein [Ferruginibacter sp.]
MKAKLFFTHWTAFAVILIFTFLISCNRNAEKQNASMDMTMADVKEPSDQKNQNETQQIPVGKVLMQASDSAGSPVPAAPAVSNPDWDSKIIKTASLKVEIKDFKKYNDYVHNAVKQYGAYVAQEDQNLTDEKSETTITIKVPVSQFENMMNKLPEDGKIIEKKISTEDVTGEVVDTRSRLEAKKQMRLKYLEFLKQSKNMEEVLQVQNEINSLQEQIESAAGRVAFLSNQAAMSTINLTFYQPLDGYNPSDATPSFLSRIGNAFKTGAGWIGALFVGLVSIWPLLLIVLAAYFRWKKLRPAKVIAQK